MQTINTMLAILACTGEKPYTIRSRDIENCFNEYTENLHMDDIIDCTDARSYGETMATQHLRMDLCVMRKCVMRDYIKTKKHRPPMDIFK